MSKLNKNLLDAVKLAREGRMLESGSIARKAVVISSIPGASELSRAHTILLENVVRSAKSDEEAALYAERILCAAQAGSSGDEIAFMPARVLFQDFTGVPVFVDFAAMRDAAKAKGIDPTCVNPKIPATLVVDHSVIADEWGGESACQKNEEYELDRNMERFSFLKWASKSFEGVSIVPPGSGICHQLNIEQFVSLVTLDSLQDEAVAAFDTLVGTDSHTTTANGLGVLGWGVGGIEAEASCLGEPISMLVPPVVELHLSGKLPAQASAMDLALRVCELLRAEGVVGSFVEVTGQGASSLSATQRACVANMTPEYGATTTLFPLDEEAFEFLALTGHNSSELSFAEHFVREQGIYGATTGRLYARTLELDLGTITPSLAGPSRPHRRVEICDLKTRFEELAREHNKDCDRSFDFESGGEHLKLKDGTIGLAAITSCTTATDPAMMIAAGLFAKRARERGLDAKPWVKRIFAPGSHATEEILRSTHLLEPLFELGFYTCGFGCMACIGNSGDIHANLIDVAANFELTSVLSGNRNFDGRINPHIAQNYLASPALVVAYAIAGSVGVDLEHEPLGVDSEGTEVFLSELLPTSDEVNEILSTINLKSIYEKSSKTIFEGSKLWQEIDCSDSACYSWDENSSYIRKAPYFDIAHAQERLSIRNARALVYLGDFVTTDHISPAGSIADGSAAALYLESRGINKSNFNSYGSRRGNHELMERGTFANIRLENKLASKGGPLTIDFTTGKECSIFDVASNYKKEGRNLIVLAGKMYGSGSSRDWAAKGPLLLGVSAVIAESFERIHRSNLVQMGIVPLEFCDGESASSLGLSGRELFEIDDISLDPAALGQCVRARATDDCGNTKEFELRVRIDTASEYLFMQAGGILPFVLNKL